jgi:hypothetical protein
MLIRHASWKVSYSPTCRLLIFAQPIADSSTASAVPGFHMVFPAGRLFLPPLNDMLGRYYPLERKARDTQSVEKAVEFIRRMGGRFDSGVLRIQQGQHTERPQGPSVSAKERLHQRLHEKQRAYSMNCTPFALLEPPAGIEPATY